MNKFKIKELFKMKYLLQVCFSLLLVSCFGTAIAESTVKANVNMDNIIKPNPKVLEDGQVLIRHAGDEWSRQKIRQYLTENKLIFDIHSPMSDGGAKSLCPTIQRDLQNLNFEFIKPNLITDDWNDSRLEPYKEKYDKFKYGMGYNPKFEASAIPHWNINIYDLDTDIDGEIEAILYGERLTNVLEISTSYLVFESNAEWQRGGAVGGYSDPSGSYLDPDDYILSALIKVRNIYTSISINDYDVPGLAERQFYVRLYFIGLQDKYRRGANYNSYRCYYDLKPATNSKQ